MNLKNQKQKLNLFVRKTFTFTKIHLSQYIALLISDTNKSLSMSMASKAAPLSMGQWPGANMIVLMEAFYVLGCMGKDGTDNHG